MAKFDTVLSAVRQDGISVVITTVCTGRFRVLVTGQSDEVIEDIQWPSSPLSAAHTARFILLRALGRKTYHVNLWGSKPGTDDDCWCGDDFETVAAARACYNNPERFFSSRDLEGTAWIELGVDYAECSPEGYKFVDTIDERPNPGYDRAKVEREEAAYAAMCRNERAMQTGMAFGCQGYNDEMGW